MSNRVYVSLRLNTIHDDGEKTTIEWVVVDNRDSRFSEPALPSCFKFGNRDIFYEQAQVKPPQCKTLKGQVFTARIYESRGDWLVAPESLSLVANAATSVVTPPEPFNPALPLNSEITVSTEAPVTDTVSQKDSPENILETKTPSLPAEDKYVNMKSVLGSFRNVVIDDRANGTFNEKEKDNLRKVDEYLRLAIRLLPK